MPTSARKLRDVLGPVRVLEIEAAALRVIARRGLSAATMQEIATEAGLAKGTLYLYFQGRDELVRHLAEAAFEELLAGQSDVLSRPGPVREVLGEALRKQVDFFEARREFFRIYLDVAHPGDASASACRERGTHPLYDAYLEKLAAFFDAARARGELLCDRPGRLALFLAEGMNGLVLRRLNEKEPPPPEADVQLVLDAVLGGVGADRRIT